MSCSNWSDISLALFVRRLLPLQLTPWLTSMLQYASVIPVDGMVFCPHVRLRQISPWSLWCYAPSDVLVVDTLYCQCAPFHRCMVLHKHLHASLEGGGLSEKWTDGRAWLELRSDVEVFTYSTDPLTNTSYEREVDSWSPLLLPFLFILPRSNGCNGRMKVWG